MADGDRPSSGNKVAPERNPNAFIIDQCKLHFGELDNAVLYVVIVSYQKHFA